jgi:hypothetical protein
MAAIILRLERLDSKVLEAGQLLEDIARGCDRVAAVEERPTGETGGGQEAERGRFVAIDAAVTPGCSAPSERGSGREQLRCLTEVVASLQGVSVRMATAGFFCNFASIQRNVGSSELVQPEHKAKRKEVLGAVYLLCV